MIDERVERLEAEINRLREEQVGMQRTIQAMSGTLVRRLEKDILLQRRTLGRLGYLEGMAADTAKVVRELVKSRIWKSLIAVGGLILRVAPGNSSGKSSSLAESNDTETTEPIQLRCDSLSARTIDPVAGKIEITGWCIAPEGIKRVEISVGSYPALRVRYGNPAA